jgi:hypothetical protein
MKVFVERSGGFAGIKLSGSLDSSMLPLSKARRLAALVEKSGFFSLPSILESNTPSADHFSYKVTVETDAATHTIEACEEAIPKSMRPLLDFLSRALRPQRL